MLRLQAIAAIVLLVPLFGCSDTGSNEEAAMPESELYSMPLEERRDRYEARDNDSVGYSNPNTGYTADYTLDVEYNSDGSVERINFPNGGWQDHFVDERDNYDGTVTVTTDDGKEYTVAKGDNTENDEESEDE